jgi:GNAT superfamily N-acetyltransferase
MVSDLVRIVDGFSEKRFLEYLRMNYEDRPLVDLPGFVLSRMLKKWAARDDVIFKVSLIKGEPVGFIFGQAVGAKPWRTLLFDLVGAPAAALILVKERFGRAVSSSEDVREPTPFPIYDEKRAIVSRGWLKGEAANVEFVFVERSARGKGVALKLIRAFSDTVRQTGVAATHAYIARHNSASARAFQKSGWSIFDDGNTLRAMSRIDAK